MPLQLDHLNKPAYSAFQLRSSECRKLLNELTTLIFSYDRDKSNKPSTLQSSLPALQSLLKDAERDRQEAMKLRDCEETLLKI